MAALVTTLPFARYTNICEESSISLSLYREIEIKRAWAYCEAYTAFLIPDASTRVVGGGEARSAAPRRGAPVEQLAQFTACGIY